MWLRKARMTQYYSSPKAGVGMGGCNHFFTGGPIYTQLFWGKKGYFMNKRELSLGS